jgi:hypothetical protein
MHAYQRKNKDMMRPKGNMRAFPVRYPPFTGATFMGIPPPAIVTVVSVLLECRSVEELDRRLSSRGGSRGDEVIEYRPQTSDAMERLFDTENER